VCFEERQRLVLKGAMKTRRHIMNSINKSILKIGLLSLLSVMPLAAQIDNGVDFKTSFPFNAGVSKLPAGNYKVFQPDMNIDTLQIQSMDTLHSVFVDFIPTQSLQPRSQSAVTFEKYGDTSYLNRVWIEGQNYGIKVHPTKVETEAAADANVTQHSTAARGQ
jgi:hypothetical protein